MNPRPIVFLVLALLLAAGCDSAMEDAEDGPITRVALTLGSDASPDELEWSAEQPEGLVQGVTLRQDTLYLTAGSDLQGRLELFSGNNADWSARIRDDAENFQIFYYPSGVEGLRISATDRESEYGSNEFGSDLLVGLAFAIKTPATSSVLSGSIRVKVAKFPVGLKNGSTLTVEPISDFVIPVRVHPAGSDPPDPEPEPNASRITGLDYTLERHDELRRVSMRARRAPGLLMDLQLIEPDSVEIEICTRESTAQPYACTESNAIVLHQGESYSGRLTVIDSEQGDAFTDVVRDNGDEYQFFFPLNFGPSGMTILDTDSRGLPIGLEMEWDLPTNVTVRGSMGFRLFRFDEDEGGDKQQGVNPQKLLEFRARFELLRPPPPPGAPVVETFSWRLERSDSLRRVTVTATHAGGLNLDGAPIDEDDLEIQACERSSVALEYQCVNETTFFFFIGETYHGTVSVGDRERGEAFTEFVRENPDEFRFFYHTSAGLTIVDTDNNGRPLGLETTWDIPQSTSVNANLPIRLHQYDPDFGGDKAQGIETHEPIFFGLTYSILRP